MAGLGADFIRIMPCWRESPTRVIHFHVSDVKRGWCIWVFVKARWKREDECHESETRASQSHAAHSKPPE